MARGNLIMTENGDTITMEKGNLITKNNTKIIISAGSKPALTFCRLGIY
jgi:hypothetical protein